MAVLFERKLETGTYFHLLQHSSHQGLFFEKENLWLSAVCGKYFIIICNENKCSILHKHQINFFYMYAVEPNLNLEKS